MTHIKHFCNQVFVKNLCRLQLKIKSEVSFRIDQIVECLLDTMEILDQIFDQKLFLFKKFLHLLQIIFFSVQSILQRQVLVVFASTVDFFSPYEAFCKDKRYSRDLYFIRSSHGLKNRLAVEWQHKYSLFLSFYPQIFLTIFHFQSPHNNHQKRKSKSVILLRKNTFSKSVCESVCIAQVFVFLLYPWCCLCSRLCSRTAVSIHSSQASTLVQTPGTFGLPQPIPKLTIPTWYH